MAKPKRSSLGEGKEETSRHNYITPKQVQELGGALDHAWDDKSKGIFNLKRYSVL